MGELGEGFTVDHCTHATGINAVYLLRALSKTAQLYNRGNNARSGSINVENRMARVSTGQDKESDGLRGTAHSKVEGAAAEMRMMWIWARNGFVAKE